MNVTIILQVFAFLERAMETSAFLMLGDRNRVDESSFVGIRFRKIGTK